MKTTKAKTTGKPKKAAAAIKPKKASVVSKTAKKKQLNICRVRTKFVKKQGKSITKEFPGGNMEHPRLIGMKQRNY